MYRWSDAVDADHIDRVREAFDALPRRVAGIRRLDHGVDVGVTDGGFDYLVIAEFETIAEWRTFRDHPDVVLLEQELLVGHVVEQAGGQLQVGAERSSIDVGPVRGTTGTSPAGDEAESDEELMARARRAAMAEMEALMAEPDDGPPLPL